MQLKGESEPKVADNSFGFSMLLSPQFHWHRLYISLDERNIWDLFLDNTGDMKS